MARILFIGDNFVNESLGVMYLSAYLKANGHEVFLTLLSEHRKIDAIIDYVEDVSPDLVAFSVMTPQVEKFRDLSREIKDRTGRTIIWGGSHCMFMFNSVTSYEFLDIICVGDGEDSLLTLMNRIEAKEEYNDIHNLSVRVDGEWKINPLSPLENDLDKYPFPDRDIYYEKYPLLGNLTIKRLITSRGCPYKCSYCYQPTYFEVYKGVGKSKIFRRHSVTYVIDEVKNIQRRYPLKNVHFSDDIFNLDKKWIKQFGKRFKDEIGLPFSCNIEITSIDEETVAALAGGGCFGVTYGLESGVENTRINLLNKYITDKRYIEVTELLHKYNITVMANVMVCLPHESLDQAIDSLRFAASLKTYSARISVLKVYKGTQLARDALEKGWCEGVGEFTYKLKDIHRDFEKIRHIHWFGGLVNKLPFLMRWAKPILSSRLARHLRFLVILNHWEDSRFFRFSLWQAFQFFWNSRDVFVGGLSKDQKDTYVEVDGASRPGDDLFSSPTSPAKSQ